MWTLIIIIFVVVVVDDDTYYWVYLSSDHLFQVYYKVRQVLLQSATAFFITKCDGLLLQSATAFLLQSATSVIRKCDRYYKVWQFYYKVRQVLQSATIITKCDSTIGVWPAQCKFALQLPTWSNSMQHVTVCCPLSFLMATLAEENFWTLKVHLAVTLLKIRLEL